MWGECKLRDKEIADAYHACEWMTNILIERKYPNSEVRKIFIKAQDITNKGLFIYSYTFFAHQITSLIKLLAPNDPRLNDPNFQKLVEHGKKILNNQDLAELVFIVK